MKIIKKTISKPVEIERLKPLKNICDFYEPLYRKRKVSLLFRLVNVKTKEVEITI